MDERIVIALGYVYCHLSDAELVSELLRLTNDICFCLTDTTLEDLNFYERYKVILSELRKRGLAQKESEPD